MNFVSGSYKNTVLKSADIQHLRTRLHGQVLLPEDSGYDKACQVWVPTFVQHPALIVLPTTTADVAESVMFAQEHDLPIAIQGGGHGHPVPAEGAILINFMHMTGVQIDPKTSRARLEAGVRWIQVIEAAHQFGLAPLAGFAPTVGAISYLLGGGYGWLVRQYGLGAGSIHAVEIVTADGNVLQVNEQSHPDLFWGLRGGGGNFGVVTAVEITLYPVKEVFGGQVIYPIEQGKEVAKAYLDWVKTVPVELTSAFRVMHFPPLPELPPFLRGKSVVMIAACYNGTTEDGEALLCPMRTLGAPLLDTFGRLPFSQIATISNDPVKSSPGYFYTYQRPMHDITANDVDAFFEIVADPASSLFALEIRHFGGVLADVPENAMAVSMRDVNFNVWILATAPQVVLLERGKQAIATVMQALKSETRVQALFNSLTFNDVGPDRTRMAYTPENYRRLVALKDQYDPRNIFRINHNILPSQQQQ